MHGKKTIVYIDCILQLLSICKHKKMTIKCNLWLTNAYFLKKSKQKTLMNAILMWKILVLPTTKTGSKEINEWCLIQDDS